LIISSFILPQKERVMQTKPETVTKKKREKEIKREKPEARTAARPTKL
jgi:hypothetical protein